MVLRLTSTSDEKRELETSHIYRPYNCCFCPDHFFRVMEILKEAAGPNRVPEFQSTHPDPDNRIEKIREAIAEYKGGSTAK